MSVPKWLRLYTDLAEDLSSVHRAYLDIILVGQPYPIRILGKSRNYGFWGLVTFSIGPVLY